MNIPKVAEVVEEVRRGQKDLLVVLLALGDLTAAQLPVPDGKTAGNWKRATADVRGRVAP